MRKKLDTARPSIWTCLFIYLAVPEIHLDTLYLQEFHTIYQQFFPNGDPTKFASFVFNVFDANKVHEHYILLE